MSSDSGGAQDKETISGLLVKYSAYTCSNPSKINVRDIATKSPATLAGGPQIYRSVDTKAGFVCVGSDQSNGACLDYEVQLCCPGFKFISRTYSVIELNFFIKILLLSVFLKRVAY